MKNKNTTLKKENKKVQFVLFGLCSLVALAVCMAVLFITVDSVKATESTEVKYETESKTKLKNDDVVLKNYIKRLTENTIDNKFIKFKTYKNLWVDDSSVLITNSATNTSDYADTEIFKYVKNKILPEIKNFYPEDYTGVFGKNSNDTPLVNIPLDYISDCKYTTGLTNETGEQVIDDNGNLEDNEFYYIYFDIENPSILKDNTLLNCFGVNETEKVKERFIKENSSVCNFKDFTLKPKNFKITAKINRLKDEILTMTFESSYSIKTEVEFTDKLDFLGEKIIEFEYGFSKTFEYSYAGISFSEKSVLIEPGDETALSVNAVIENDSEYEVVFKSSDDTIVTVDEMGYIKGIKQSGNPVSITVILKYLDKTFTDECEVTVSEIKE